MLRFAVVTVSVLIGSSPAFSYDPIGTTPPDYRGIGVPRTPAAGEMIRRFDRDGDGKLDAQELRSMHEARQHDALRGRREGRPPRRGDRRPRLEQFDRNGDGRLSHDEAAAFHQAIAKSMIDRGVGIPSGSAIRKHHEMDLNRDGIISQDEMRAHRERLDR